MCMQIIIICTYFLVYLYSTAHKVTDSCNLAVHSSIDGVYSLLIIQKTKTKNASSIIQSLYIINNYNISRV